MRVIWPDEPETVSAVPDREPAPSNSAAELLRSRRLAVEPVILPFPTLRQQPVVNLPAGIRPEEQSPEDRARLIRHNRFCRRCQKALVSLILAEDGRRDGTGGFVPGTQTLIGFRCECCHCEWPARP